MRAGPKIFDFEVPVILEQAEAEFFDGAKSIKLPIVANYLLIQVKDERGVDAVHFKSPQPEGEVLENQAKFVHQEREIVERMLK
jgi:hypothetical protein